ncbi:TfoX/Sxy family protein [Rubrivivax gelatinosus]|uniref:DNA transformation protein n=1 Tax=Rubrivivax gelatinosus TaxID=28068 RepID=A0A4R2MJL6_RUBGE|nr:TfoX/Sxy family protein [Rubrivivax gelatinosus]MBK1688262.1 competence protein TfoX [Rubrivivax gelatinosus]TCP05535.1 DNA transformation protein [Rubrivivax gelatinosus]
MRENPFAQHCRELLAPLGAVRVRRMFGGHGFDIDGLFVALILGEQLYLKTCAATEPDFEAAGGQPFRYRRAGREMQLGFWTPPAEALEAPEAMRPWAQRALQAALAARAPKARAPRRR